MKKEIQIEASECKSKSSKFLDEWIEKSHKRNKFIEEWERRIEEEATAMN